MSYKKEYFILLGVTLLIFTFSSAQKIDYQKKYAGEYIIQMEGVSSSDIERYILKPNGECIWKWETGRYPDTKYGKWTASEGLIKTVFKGKSGSIPEDFTWLKGKFRSSYGNDRTLKKLKAL